MTDTATPDPRTQEEQKMNADIRDDAATAERPLVEFTWEVTTRHRLRMPAERWARFISVIDPNEEHNLPRDLSSHSLDVVFDFLNTGTYWADDEMTSMATNNTWIESDDPEPQNLALVFGGGNSGS